MIQILEEKTTSPEETRKLADFFWKNYIQKEKNVSVFFTGKLGAGKTIFIQELMKNFGVNQEITSPTYIFVNQYQTSSQSFAHFDFYRLPEPSEFFAHGFEEWASNEKILKFVEWPEKITPKIKKLFSGTHFEIQITPKTGDKRLISIFKNS